jgi:hypothetical protein
MGRAAADRYLNLLDHMSHISWRKSVAHQSSDHMAGTGIGRTARDLAVQDIACGSMSPGELGQYERPGPRSGCRVEYQRAMIGR